MEAAISDDTLLLFSEISHYHPQFPGRESLWLHCSARIWIYNDCYASPRVPIFHSLLVKFDVTDQIRGPCNRDWEGWLAKSLFGFQVN